MKNIYFVCIFFLGLQLVGCSAGISTTGYEPPSIYEGLADCKVVIKENYQPEENEIEILGKIKAYDTGFSVNCAESQVLTRFFRDGCSIGADVINITEEKYPNFWSTCYRAKAEFIRLKNRELADIITSDPKYDREKIRARSKETWIRTDNAVGAGIMGGIIGGMMSAPR